MVHLQIHQMMGFHAKNNIKEMMVRYAQFDIHEKIGVLTEFAGTYPKIKFYSADDLYQAANKQIKSKKTKKGSTTTVNPNQKKDEKTKNIAKEITRKIRQLKRFDNPKLDKSWDESYNTQSALLVIPNDITESATGSIFNVRMDKTEHEETHSVLILMLMAKLIQYPKVKMREFVSSMEFVRLMERIEDLLEENILYGLTMEDAIEKILHDNHQTHRVGLKEYFTNMQVSLKIKLTGLDNSQKKMFIKYLTDNRIKDVDHISRMIGYIGEVTHRRGKQPYGNISGVTGSRILKLFDKANTEANIEKDSGKYDDIDPKNVRNSKELFGSFAFVEKGRHIKLDKMQSNVRHIKEFFTYNPKDALVKSSLDIESDQFVDIEIKTSVTNVIKKCVLSVITNANREISKLKTIEQRGSYVNFRLETAIKNDMRFTLTSNGNPPTVDQIGYNKTDDRILLDILKNRTVRQSMEIIMTKLITELNTTTIANYINGLISDGDSVSEVLTNITRDTTPRRFRPEIKYDLEKLSTTTKEWVLAYLQGIPDVIFPHINPTIIADNLTPELVTEMIRALYLDLHSSRTKTYHASPLVKGSGYSSEDIDNRVANFAEITSETHTQTLFLHGSDIIVLYNVYQMDIESVSKLANYSFKSDQKSMTKILKDEKFLIAAGLENTNLYVLIGGNVFHRSYNINKFTVRILTLAKMKQQSDKFTEINKKQNTKGSSNGNDRR